MTSDRGSSGAAELQLNNTPVTPKLAGLNPNASVFLSHKSSQQTGGQSAPDTGQAWDHNDSGIGHSTSSVSDYSFANGDVSADKNECVVFSPSSESPFQGELAPFPDNHAFNDPNVQMKLEDGMSALLQNTGPYMEPVSPGSTFSTGLEGGVPMQGVTYTNDNGSITDGESPLGEAAVADDQKRLLLKAQLENYFSRENLSTDTYLQSQMDADQYVPIATVASLDQVQRLTTDHNLIVELLRESTFVQVDEKGERVRPNHNRCIVILREIPDTTPVEDVQNLFSGSNCPKLAEVKFAHNNNWYVTFDSDADAQRAYQYLREEVKTFLGKPIMARIKAKPLIRMNQPQNGYKGGYQQSPVSVATSQIHAEPVTTAMSVAQHQQYTAASAYTLMQSTPLTQSLYGQQPIPFYPPPPSQLVPWQNPTLLDPSMVLAMNGYHATNVKVNNNQIPNRNTYSTNNHMRPNNRNQSKPGTGGAHVGRDRINSNDSLPPRLQHQQERQQNALNNNHHAAQHHNKPSHHSSHGPGGHPASHQISNHHPPVYPPSHRRGDGQGQHGMPHGGNHHSNHSNHGAGGHHHGGPGPHHGGHGNHNNHHGGSLHGPHSGPHSHHHGNGPHMGPHSSSGGGGGGSHHHHHHHHSHHPASQSNSGNHHHQHHHPSQQQQQQQQQHLDGNNNTSGNSGSSNGVAAMNRMSSSQNTDMSSRYPPNRSYRRRRPRDEDGARPNRSNSSQSSSGRGGEGGGNNGSSAGASSGRPVPPIEKFDYEPTNFPPLPGAESNTASGEVFESKLSDVVKGTAKPQVRDTPKPSTSSSTPPSTSASTPTVTMATAAATTTTTITTTTTVTPAPTGQGSSSCPAPSQGSAGQAGGQGSKRSVVKEAVIKPAQAAPVRASPAPSASVSHPRPAASSTTTQPSVSQCNRSSKPNQQHVPEAKSSSDKQQSNPSQEEKITSQPVNSVKLSYAQMVQKAKVAEVSANSLNEGSDDSDGGEDAAETVAPASRALKEQGQHQSSTAGHSTRDGASNGGSKQSGPQRGPGKDFVRKDAHYENDSRSDSRRDNEYRKENDYCRSEPREQRGNRRLKENRERRYGGDRGDGRRGDRRERQDVSQRDRDTPRTAVAK